MSDSDEITYSAVNAILSDSRRDSVWHLTDELDVLAVCGRARFDLRQVETDPNTEVVEISVKCFLGGVSFLVPSGTMVVLDGTSFIASARSDVSGEGDPGLPRIEITATTVFGSVRVVSFDPPAEAAPEPSESVEAENAVTETTDEVVGAEPAVDETEAETAAPDEPAAAEPEVAHELAAADSESADDEAA